MAKPISADAVEPESTNTTLTGARYPSAARRSSLKRWLARAGRTLIAAGVLVLLFAAYELWGTGLYTSRAQNRLKSDFRNRVEQSAGPPSTTLPAPTTTAAPPSSTTPSISPAPVPRIPVAVAEGDPVARIVAPKIDLDWVVVHGVSVADLKKGPGHYEATPLPGESGNVGLAGHRTTYGAPFFRINELKPGDDIRVTTVQGEFRYVVTGQQVVTPDHVDVLNDFGDNRLTLTSCEPRYSAKFRIIVTAVLAGSPAPTPPATTAPAAPATPPTTGVARAESAGTASGRRGSVPGAILWGMAFAAVWFAVWLLGRRWRRWPVYLLCSPVLVVVLFLFFQNLSDLLPPNL